MGGTSKKKVKKGTVHYTDQNFGMSMSFNKDAYAVVESSEEEVEEDDEDDEDYEYEIQPKPKVKQKQQSKFSDRIAPVCPPDAQDGKIFSVEEDEYSYFFWRMDTMGRTRRRQFSKGKSNKLPSLAYNAIINDGATDEVLEQLDLTDLIRTKKNKNGSKVKIGRPSSQEKEVDLVVQMPTMKLKMETKK